jgi:hypothetical protein
MKMDQVYNLILLTKYWAACCFERQRMDTEVMMIRDVRKFSEAIRHVKELDSNFSETVFIGG